MASMRRGILYGLAAIGALWTVWTTYEVVIPEPTDVLPERLSRADSVPLARVLAANLGVAVVEGNRIEPLANGVEIFPPMLEAIRSARESVSFLTYVYWTGDIAREFADELTAACRRGVEVRVLLDAYGARRMDETHVARMRDAGCRVAWFHPVRWYTIRRFNHRTHRRALVVDGRIGFTGGVGIGEEWTGDAEDPGHWRDEHFRLEGPIVRWLQGAFAENWRAATGELLSGARLFPELPPAGEARIVPVLDEPGGSVSRTALAYWTLLQGARRKVNVWTPYFVPDPDLLDAIVETARRGAEVTLLVPGDHNDSRVVRWASRVYYDDLLDAGVRVFEYAPTMMHVKAITVDDEWAVVGTANFDSRALELNYEIVLAVEDAGLVQALDRRFVADLARSRRIGRDELDARSPLERIRDRLAYALREQI